VIALHTSSSIMGDFLFNGFLLLLCLDVLCKRHPDNSHSVSRADDRSNRPNDYLYKHPENIYPITQSLYTLGLYTLRNSRMAFAICTSVRHFSVVSVRCTEKVHRTHAAEISKQTDKTCEIVEHSLR